MFFNYFEQRINDKLILFVVRKLGCQSPISNLQRINDIKIHEVREITKTKHPME